MKYIAEINIMPKKGLLDPQGKAVAQSLPGIGLGQIADVRIGKHVTMNLEAASDEEARKSVDEACQKLLANMIMESYEFEVSPVQ
jgi:phosphoribosylformylglycinamidine synthase PurS subunit